MAQIRILPPDIVNRIAAGEVVERPASVVKELVENAIDAGATEVSIEVDDGGRQRIRVRDNGGGIPSEELPLAFRSHATSKLPLGGPPGDGGVLGQDRTALDLFDIGTLGFRGEALASIACVSEVEATSRTAESDLAHRYRLRGTLSAGDTPAGEGPDPVPGPPGTTIEVRNLFFNVPARRKFLRASSTELSHIVEQVVRLALGFPGVRICLTSGGRRLLDCPATSSLRERLAAVLGRERAEELLEVREAAEVPSGLKIRGFVGPPSLHRADAKGQQFFVGGRWIRDRIIGHALQEAYKGFQIPGQRPLAYLFIDVPRGSLDVNVHPTKSEVRFLDSSAIFRAVQGAVRSALESSAGGGSSGAVSSRGPSADAEAARQRVMEAARGFFDAPRRAQESRSSGGGGGANAAPRIPLGAGPRRAGTGEDRPWEAGFRAGAPGPADTGRTPSRTGSGEDPQGAAGTVPSVPSVPAAAQRPIQVFQSYILVESGDDLVFFDQHALHEKVLYERILAQLRAGPMLRQRLLLPEVVEMPLELAPLMEETARRLAALGFEAEPIGPREMAVHAVPAILETAAAGPIVVGAARWILDGAAASEGPAPDGSPAASPIGAEVRRLAQLIACKQAVKAGMPLKDDEVRALFQGAAAAADPRFCPHGRPTCTVISRSELERRFQRK